MRLLIWTQHFWPEQFLINDIAVALQKSGVQVTVVTGKPNYPQGKIFKGYRAWGVQRETHQGVEVIRLPIFPRGQGSAVRLALNYLSFIFAGFLIAPWLLRSQRVDSIFVYGVSPLLKALPAILVAKIKRAKLTMWVQDLWPESLQATGYVRNTFLLSTVKQLVRFIYKCSDLILLQSSAFMKPVRNIVPDADNIQYFPNIIVDSAKATRHSSTDLALLSDIDKHFSVIFAGNIGHAQGCEIVVRAAQLLVAHTHIKFYLLGEGSSAAKLKQAIESTQLTNVVMPGRLPSDEMPNIFDKASTLLLNLRDNGALNCTVPSKLQHYLASAKPIIACMNGEAARLVNEAGAGMSCAAEDAEALAEIVLAMSRCSEDELAQMGQAGRCFFEVNYDLQVRLEELKSLLSP